MLPMPGLFGVLVLVSAMAGCTGIELDERPPTPVALSGEWLLDPVSSGSPDLSDPKLAEERLDRRSRSRDRRIMLGSGLAFIAHDFQVLGADKMMIEQSRDSLGIRYFPGVYRDVSWGERERGLWEVYAGWEDVTMVVISNAPDMRVVERFDLVSPTTLKITVSITADGDDHEIVRVFDRHE
jgi:hypothetical protein